MAKDLLGITSSSENRHAVYKQSHEEGFSTVNIKANLMALHPWTCIDNVDLDMFCFSIIKVVVVVARVQSVL